MNQTAHLLFDSQCQLGEGPIWHPGRQQLFFFDINEQTLFAVTADGEVADSWLFNETVAAAAILDDDMLVLATETGLKEFDLATGGMNRINEIEADNPVTRTNERRVHPWGAVWIGTMGKVYEEAPVGSVYHYRAGALTTLKSGIKIPNATCFSPDGRIAYWTDTPTRQILKCATDPATGLPVGEWTVFAEIDRIELDRNKELEKILLKVLPRTFAIVWETARRFKENRSASSEMVGR